MTFRFKIIAKLCILLDFINRCPMRSFENNLVWCYHHFLLPLTNLGTWKKNAKKFPAIFLLKTKLIHFDTNLSFINWKIERLITSSINIRTPCAQFQMSVMRKIILPGVSKNEIISKSQAMPAITKRLKYTCTLDGQNKNYFKIKSEMKRKSHLSMCLVAVFWESKPFSFDWSVAVALLRASW